MNKSSNPSQTVSNSMFPEVKLLCTLTFADMEMKTLYDGIEFSKKIHLPILPCPFVCFVRVMDLDITVEKWQACEQENGDYIVCAVGESLEILIGSESDIESITQEMLEHGWVKED